MEGQSEARISTSPEQIVKILEAKRTSLLQQHDFLATELAAIDQLLADNGIQLAEQRILNELDRSWQ